MTIGDSEVEMNAKVSTAQAKATLSALITHAANGQRVVIERRGKPLAALVGMEDLELIKREAPTSPHPQGALVLIGAWSELEDEELDALVNHIYAQRLEDTGRQVDMEG